MRNKFFVLVCCLFASSTLYAFNLDFMRYSASYYFTKEDWSIAQATAVRTLDQGRDNAKVSWNNPNSGSSGYFVPYGTTNQNGLRCRNLKMHQEANHVTGGSIYHFCKINGDWRIVEPD